MLTASVLLQAVLQETLRRQHGHLLLPGPAEPQVSLVVLLTFFVFVLCDCQQSANQATSCSFFSGVD